MHRHARQCCGSILRAMLRPQGLSLLTALLYMAHSRRTRRSGRSCGSSCKRARPASRFDPRIPSLDFAVRHYAGDVLYSCDKFLDKNRDSLSPGARALTPDSP